MKPTHALALLWICAATAAHAATPNLLVNPEIEADLSGWTGQGGALTTVALDVFGRVADSKAAQLASVMGTDVTLSQCVAIPANAHLDFGAWIQIPSFQEVTGSAVVKLEWWSEPGCTGTEPDVAAETATITTTGRWSYAALRDVTPPVGTMSAKLRAIVQPDDTGFLAQVDSLFVAPAGALFVPAAGEVLVADGSRKIVKVEPETGVQRLLASEWLLVRPTGVAIDADGLVWVVSPNGTPLVTVDPATGLQDVPVTTGATLSAPWDVDVALDGSLWIAGSALWELAWPTGEIALRKSLPSTAYGLHVDGPPGEPPSLVVLARGSAGLSDFDPESSELTAVAGTPTAPGRYDYGVWTPPGSSTRVFTEVEPIAPSGCNAPASGVLAVDDGGLLPNPSLGGLFRCPRGLGAGGPDEPGYVSDGTVPGPNSGSQEGQILTVDRGGSQALVTRSGFLVDPWDVEVVPEPGGALGALAAACALAALATRAAARQRAPGSATNCSA